MADSKDVSRWLPILAMLALGAGLYARFKGLGTWPFGVDEYYISRSIDFILLSGVPEYPCGGYYHRGIIIQYVIAGLRNLGLTAEFAGRIVPAVSSLAVLPAAYLLGRRLHSSVVGWLAVIVLALSVWEVEMARFARMYAPFQAIFAWYLLYFLRFSVDRETRAAFPMLLLSVLGVLTWEGGALLAVTNLLPVLMRHQGGSIGRRDWLYLLIAVPVGAMILLTLSDWRYHSEIPPFDEAVVLEQATEAFSATSPALMAGLARPWLLGLLLPAGLAALALPWIWSLRHRWLAAAGLLLALAAAFASQLLLALAVVVALLLMRMLDLRELFAGRARWFLAALAACAIFWFAFAAAGVLQESGFAPARLVLAVTAQLVGITDVFAEIVRPWGSTQPLLTLLIGVALVALTCQCLFGRSGGADIAAMLVLVLVLALAIGASDPPRHETRYTFFLFPLLVVLGLAALAIATSRIPGKAGSSPVVTILAALLLFGVSEDFQPRHLAKIDSAEANFRTGMSRQQTAHLYPRADFRKVAQWLSAHTSPEDQVISGVPPIAQYYPGVAYSFLDEHDDRYFAFACQRGTVDRWSNLPLLYRTEALEPRVAQPGRILIVLYPDRLARVAAEADEQGWKHETHWPTGEEDIGVLVIN